MFNTMIIYTVRYLQNIYLVREGKGYYDAVRIVFHQLELEIIRYFEERRNSLNFHNSLVVCDKNKNYFLAKEFNERLDIWRKKQTLISIALKISTPRKTRVNTYLGKCQEILPGIYILEFVPICLNTCLHVYTNDYTHF